MSRYTIRSFLITSAILSSALCSDDSIHFPNDEYANTQQYSQQPAVQQNNEEIQSRSPFSTSFSIGLGPNRGHSIGLSTNKDGISLSQSTSLGGRGPLAGSQSNSFSAGRSGLAASDSNAFNIFGKSKANTNAFSLGDAKASSQADVKDGKVSSGAQSSVGNEYNKVSSGASSSAGNGEATADSDASAVQNDEYPNRPYFGQRNDDRPHGFRLFRPIIHRDGLHISIGNYNPHEPQVGNSEAHETKFRPGRERRWKNVNCATNPDCNGRVNFASENTNPWPQPYPIDASHQGNYPPESWSQDYGNRRPEGTRVSAASASSSVSSSGNGFAIGHSSSQSNLGPNGPSSKTVNQLHTSGDAQSHAQSVAAGIQQDSNGQTQGSFSSGSITGSSHGLGQSFGNAKSENKGEFSEGKVDNSAKGSGSSSGSANAAAVSFEGPTHQEQDDFIPAEFVRSGIEREEEEPVRPVQTPRGRSGSQEQKGPIRRVLSDIKNTFSGIFGH